MAQSMTSFLACRMTTNCFDLTAARVDSHAPKTPAGSNALRILQSWARPQNFLLAKISVRSALPIWSHSQVGCLVAQILADPTFELTLKLPFLQLSPLRCFRPDAVCGAPRYLTHHCIGRVSH